MSSISMKLPWAGKLDEVTYVLPGASARFYYRRGWQSLTFKVINDYGSPGIYIKPVCDVRAFIRFQAMTHQKYNTACSSGDIYRLRCRFITGALCQ
jgi:hypothetical protein